MKNNMFYLFTFFLIILLSGCQSLPPGKPPIGQIVKVSTSTNKALELPAAVNCMVTAVATSEEFTENQLLPVVKLLPVITSYNNYKTDLDSFNLMLYKQLLQMEIIELPFKSAPTLLLQSKFNKISPAENLNADSVLFNWKVKLLSPSGKTLWNFIILVEVPEKNMESKAVLIVSDHNRANHNS